MKKYILYVKSRLTRDRRVLMMMSDICELFEWAVVTEDYLDTMKERIKAIKAAYERKYPNLTRCFLNTEFRGIVLLYEGERRILELQAWPVSHEYSAKEGGAA